MTFLFIVVGWLALFVGTGTGEHTCADGGIAAGNSLKDAPALQDELEGGLRVIAFGSCNRHDQPQPLWDDIIAQKPDLWIWLGDNIYGDTRDMALLKSKYDAQKARPEYQALLTQCPAIGIWDDHDYGANDAGKEYVPKAESRDLMFDFLGLDMDSPERQHTGGYQAHVFGPNGQKVKCLMLDARYFRDKARRENRVYQPNPTGTILGEQQWAWLEHHLRDSSIQLFVLASGIQVLASQHRFEKWANFPNERQRLIDLIEETAPPGVILLSGDRHIGEISVYESEELPYPLVDITSSGLTHAFTGNTSESNDLRYGRIVNQLNFGVMKIDWREGPEVVLELRGDGGELLQSYSVSFKDD